MNIGEKNGTKRNIETNSLSIFIQCTMKNVI